MKKIISILLPLFIIMGGTLFSDEKTESRVRKLSHQLRCPTCQSQSVKESEAGLSVNMKTKIRDLINNGKSDQEILNYFVERYGEWILRSPQKTGFNLLLWFLPAIAISIATVVLIRNLKSSGASRKKREDIKPIEASENAKISRQFEKVFKKK